ncbi:MAG TPA: CorA family divalent cation transporter [Candidatus Binatia bacterium]|nr:CorA family divalent cation transporter [Candidatus Binatia bacterium]
MYELLKLSAGDGADNVGDVTWVDVDVSDEAGTNWLSTQSGLSEEVKSQLLQPGKFSKRENLEEGLLVNLCAINPASEAEVDDMIILGLFLEQNRVISVRSRKIVPIEEVRSHVKAGTGPRTPLGFLAFTIVCIKKRLEPLITRISEETAEMEAHVLEDNMDSRSEDLNALRREVFRVRRYVSPFQNILRLIVSDPTINTSDEESRALDGAAELLTRYLNALEDCRERTLLLHDLIEARVSQTMARATYNLTIIATVFLPLSFVTGLLGMNVAGIPEEHNPWGFWVVVGALVLLAIGSWAWLRWKKWLIQA